MDHPLVEKNHPILRYILVYMQDTSPEARKDQLKFENTLKVPLGPKEVQYKTGMFLRYAVRIQADLTSGNLI